VNLPTLRRAPAPAYRIVRPALTAAAKSGNPDRNQPRDRLRRLHQDWQLRALATYDTVGECWYPSQFYARSLAKTRWFPAVLNDKGEAEEQESGPLADLFARIHDPGNAGMAELAASYGRLQFLNGDGYMVVSEDEEPGDEAWEYLSVNELRIDPGGREGAPQRYRRLRGPGFAPEELSEAPDTEFSALNGADVRVWRLWRSHPSHSQLADAPIRAVLDLYELLHRLTLAAAAEAMSRAAQRGLLVIAEELTQHFQRGPDDDPDSDPFLERFGEALTNAIENPGDAGAASPILLRGPGMIPGGATGSGIPIKDLVSWVQIGPADRYLEGDMWEKTIARIGNGLDLPREFLTGVEKANHWTGWLIDEQGYRQHISPVSERFASDIASAYLRPAARDEGFADWQRVVVGYDPAEAILHPDKVQTAFDAWDRLIVSNAYVLDAIGAGDEDIPSDEELERRIMVLLKQDPFATEGDEADGETAPTDGGTGGDTVKGPPSSTDSGNAPASDSGSPGVQIASASNGHAVTAAALQAARIVGLAEMQVERARELAGSRLVRRSQKCAPCRDKISEVQATLIASTLGQEMVREVIDGHSSEAELVGGVGAALANKLRTWGIRGEWPDQLGALVEQHALRTLYEEQPPPLPSAFAAAVAKALR
jgi:hypothetical protein